MLATAPFPPARGAVGLGAQDTAGAVEFTPGLQSGFS